MHTTTAEIADTRCFWGEKVKGGRGHLCLDTQKKNLIKGVEEENGRERERTTWINPIRGNN